MRRIVDIFDAALNDSRFVKIRGYNSRYYCTTHVVDFTVDKYGQNLTEEVKNSLVAALYEVLKDRRRRVKSGVPRKFLTAVPQGAGQQTLRVFNTPVPRPDILSNGERDSSL